MRAGVTLADPARIDIRGTLTAGRDVTIDINLVVEGEVTLGDGVRIGPNCLIRDSRIGPGVEIQANCVIEGARGRSRGAHRPFARLRPEARSGRRHPCRQFRGDQEVDRGRGEQGQPPDLRRGCPDRARGQRRRRHHHLQLRRGQQVSDRHRGRGLHRLQHGPGGPGHRGRRGDHRCRLGDRPRCPSRAS